MVSHPDRGNTEVYVHCCCGEETRAQRGQKVLQGVRVCIRLTEQKGDGETRLGAGRMCNMRLREIRRSQLCDQMPLRLRG